MQHDETTNAGSFLVCGLGNLGQSCISLLKDFGAKVNAIDILENPNWQFPNSPDSLDKIITGDCRQPEKLEKAGVNDCRAILIVTSDDGVNIATAFAARLLNPEIRVVIRCAQENLIELLRDSLGNFDAFEVTKLPARSLALAALGTETQGHFRLENKLFTVVLANIDTTHYSWINLQLHELNNSNRRVLIHARKNKPFPKIFYKWGLNDRVCIGDQVAYIEVTDNTTNHTTLQSQNQFKRRQLANGIKWQNLPENLLDWWKKRSQSVRVVLLYAPFMAVLLVLGTVFYYLQYFPSFLDQNGKLQKFTLKDAINNSVVLIIGGFDNLFGHLKLEFDIPWLLYLFSLFLTISGTIFSGIVYAIITEKIIASRFQFSIPRPSIPKSNHVVVVGLGRVGQLVATRLQEYEQLVVGVNTTEIEPDVLPQMSVVIGNIKQALKRVNINTAKSVIAVTNDEVLNLEIALRVKAIHPQANLAIRTFDPTFSQSVAPLLPYSRVLNVYTLSAEVFVAAAFGENIESLFRLNNQTNLIVKYKVKESDSLNGKLLAEIAYGYGVAPILYQDNKGGSAEFMPSDDIKLAVGDRLILIANIKGLQLIEQGIPNDKNCQLYVEKISSPKIISKAAKIFSNISGCDITSVKKLMKKLPQTLPVDLYEHQAQRLVNELHKFEVIARIEKK
ncbi:MAG: NAD-binding protein [Calothrix sp. C42_A2020_038]|nr:NAD-binding protein [Calothrix sp. C42_A2020_038]